LNDEIRPCWPFYTTPVWSWQKWSGQILFFVFLILTFYYYSFCFNSKLIMFYKILKQWLTDRPTRVSAHIYTYYIYSRSCNFSEVVSGRRHGALICNLTKRGMASRDVKFESNNLGAGAKNVVTTFGFELLVWESVIFLISVFLLKKICFNNWKGIQNLSDSMFFNHHPLRPSQALCLTSV
jgi:hypothetical protein